MGLASLFLAASLAMGGAAWGLVFMSRLDLLGKWGEFYTKGAAGILIGAGAMMLVCFAAAAWVVLIYQAAGTLLGGILLLFLTVTAQHFLAGGFLPRVFLPEMIRRVAPAMPSAVLMDGVKMAVSGVWDMASAGKLAALLLGGFCLTAFFEQREK